MPTGESGGQREAVGDPVIAKVSSLVSNAGFISALEFGVRYVDRYIDKENFSDALRNMPSTPCSGTTLRTESARA